MNTTYGHGGKFATYGLASAEQAPPRIYHERIIEAARKVLRDSLPAPTKRRGCGCGQARLADKEVRGGWRVTCKCGRTATAATAKEAVGMLIGGGK